MRATGFGQSVAALHEVADRLESRETGEADDLRTWLNSQAVNLRAVTDSAVPAEGRSF